MTTTTDGQAHEVSDVVGHDSTLVVAGGSIRVKELANPLPWLVLNFLVVAQDDLHLLVAAGH